MGALYVVKVTYYCHMYPCKVLEIALTMVRIPVSRNNSLQYCASQEKNVCVIFCYFGGGLRICG